MIIPFRAFFNIIKKYDGTYDTNNIINMKKDTRISTNKHTPQRKKHQVLKVKDKHRQGSKPNFFLSCLITQIRKKNILSDSHQADHKLPQASDRQGVAK